MPAATTARFDVIGIGNAIVDVLARTDDDFLVAHNMSKGGMALIDEPRAQAIYDAMGPAVEISGGSAANTMVGVAGFGGRAAFIGKLKADELGRAFSHDIRAAGVRFGCVLADAGYGMSALFRHALSERGLHCAVGIPRHQ